MKLCKKPLLVGMMTGLTFAANVYASGPDNIESYRSITAKIVGGEEASEGEFPFMVYLQYNGGQWCGASVVSDYYVLTAAHCTSGRSASSFKAVVGLHRQNDMSDAQVIQVTEVINHPGYNSNTMQNDIALLKVAQKIDEKYTRITLGAPNDIYDGLTTTVIGWGDTSEGGNSPNALQKVDVPVVSLDECRSAYGSSNIHDHNVCAGLKQGGKDSCQGDSGGPLFINQAGEFRQLGVVSWGDGCARPNKYGVYTAVPSFASWINSHTGGDDGGDDGGDNGDATSLSNGKALTDLSGSAGSSKYYVLDVPTGASDISFKIAGGSGDADLYVKAGAKPTSSSYDCRPYKNGNDETCSDLPVKPGKYYVMLQGYSAYSGLSLTGSYSGGGDDGGDNGDGSEGNGVESGLSGGSGEWLHFSDVIPEGVSTLTVKMSGGSGDADLYVRKGRQPSGSRFQCRPYKDGNNESCVIPNPSAGEWFMSLRGYTDFSGVTLEWTSQ
ncbi:trypsin-like serine protease [Hahella sp. KA22]|uniref:trypsin-like serine protease n=1 Tax=Hahella sp. KA22 TaxID=1628392 RepID=UPI000FDED453|nr:trypsin-like serine protease [Hahella sp. KA22]AZZ95253.1 trypsin-like serine protease [Hahella sp. KA22]QAY52898.1 trypsin-like serine protease [Hahella sp. KA22]